MAFEKIIDIPRLNRFKTKILNLVYQKGDVYNKNEIDNKFSQLETNIDWKEAVATYNDIATTYPNPVDGWTVNVKDTDYTYRYNGTSWVAISANAIPKATQSVDGLITKEDKTKLDGIATGAEVNQNAFSKVTVGSTTVAADNKTDTLTLVAGSNVTITPDATNDKITIAATDTKYSSKAAVSGGTDVSLVTTGEKATWNAKTSNTGTITQVKANGTSIATSGVANIPAASTSAYGVTKLTSDLTGNSESLAATQKAVNELNSNFMNFTIPTVSKRKPTEASCFLCSNNDGIIDHLYALYLQDGHPCIAIDETKLGQILLKSDTDIYQPKGNYASSNHNHNGVYQPVGNYASASHNHDDRYLIGYESYIEDGFTSHDSNHYKWTFTAPVKGRYLFIVNFRPIASPSSCRLKIDSTNSDPIGGVTNVPQYAFDSFPATESFNEGESKTLLFEVEKGCDPTIRMSVIKVGN